MKFAAEILREVSVLNNRAVDALYAEAKANPNELRVVVTQPLTLGLMRTYPIEKEA